MHSEIALLLPDSSWVDQSTEKSLHICKIATFDSLSTCPSITHSVSITPDLCWNVFVHNHLISADCCSILKDLPTKITNYTILRKLLNLLQEAQLCIGNPEFVSLFKSHSKSHRMAVFVDKFAPVFDACGEIYLQTVRSSNCGYLINSNSSKSSRCPEWIKYRPNLHVRSLSSRDKKRSLTKLTDSSSHINFRYLSTPEKVTRLTNLATKNQQLSKRLHRE